MQASGMGEGISAIGAWRTGARGPLPAGTHASREVYQGSGLKLLQ